MKKLVLCIDLGSSSVRCSLYKLPNGKDETVQVFDDAVSLSWEAVNAKTGKIRLQQKLDDGTVVSLLELVDQCIDKTLEKLISLSSDDTDIVAVGFSSLVMNLVAVDGEGHAVGEDATLSYACNLPQVAAKVREVQRQLGSDGLQDLYQKTGTPIHAAYALPQLKVFYENHTEQANRVVQWQTLASLCLARWLERREGDGGWPISFSEASWTGLLNIKECEYEDCLLDLLPPACRRALPKLADFDALPYPQSLRLSFAQRWPALTTTRFFLGLGDGACANVGSKCTTMDRIACTIGTSAAARVVVPASTTESAPLGLFLYRINHELLLLGGALTDGGSVVAWIRELLNIQTNTDMEEYLTQVEELLLRDYAEATPTTKSTTSERPLVMLPFLSGERSTNFQSGATGALLGLTRATTRVHLVKACLEGVALRLAAITRLLPPDAQIWASGKALEVNAVWRQMIADCTGRTVVLDQDTMEGSSRGVACLVAASMSGGGLVTETATNVSETIPRMEGKEYWEQLMCSQEGFIDAMRPIYSN